MNNDSIMLILLCWLGSISIYSAIITIADKLSAKKGRRRVPEKNLFIAAALGGSAAMYTVMRLIRHKTKHKRFMIGLPVIMAVQILAILLAAYKL
ncbi:MAG: DUF1294 domain-containing protein [Huintestinicola sp.]